MAEDTNGAASSTQLETLQRAALADTGATERLVAPASRPNPDTVARGIAGGRTTIDQQNAVGGFGAMRSIRPPRDPRTEWNWQELDARTFEKITPQRLLELLADLSPETSDGIWLWLRACVNEWEVTAYRKNADGTRGDADPVANASLDAFMDQLTDRHGAPDVVWAMMFLGVLLRGAFFIELVLDAGGRVPLDLATPDPASARFILRQDEVIGQYWQLGQWQGSRGFVELQTPLVRYVPVDPFPGDAPYGRPLLAPVAFVALFTLGLMHDLRRVISQQGYPRHNIEILLEELKRDMPASAADNPDEFFIWAETLQKRIQAIYEALAPSDAFVHSSSVKLEVLPGAANASNMQGITGIIEWLERMLARALKLMPMMLGVGGGRDQGDANRQYEAWIAGVKTLQQLAEKNIERLLEMALQAQGIIADVEVEFEENRVAEAMRDEQVRTLEIENAWREYSITGDYPALCTKLRITAAQGVTEPLYPLAGIVGGTSATQTSATAQNTNPDAGSSRGSLALIRERIERAAGAGALRPDGRPIPALPNRALTEADADIIIAAWDASVDAHHRGMLDAEIEGEQ